MIITEYKEKEYIKMFSGFYKDYDIVGCSDIHRAKVYNEIRKGDIFNIYRGISTKQGCIWQGDLKSSLLNHIKNENTPD